MEYDLRNNQVPLAPCYMIPSLQCNSCNTNTPQNRVNDSHIQYHGASKWN